MKLNLQISDHDVTKLIAERINGLTVEPDLISPDQLGETKNAYKRYQNLEAKAAFRKTLLESLDLNTEQTKQFCTLAESLNCNGALIFGDLIDKPQFLQLVHAYDELMQSVGSKSWLHSYINLANHPAFLGNAEFNNAFIHPLMMTFIAYRLGAPIRIVDARAKDAEPLTVLAQDNMLHIDNTPFNDEYKMILTWERGQASGPKGQNFAFLPGTHNLVRRSLPDRGLGIWSSENASVFITKPKIEGLFAMQHSAGFQNPTVVVAEHPQKPLSTIFAAGSLVHHRYRTPNGSPRSCMIIAFHSSQDNPGQLIDDEYRQQLDKMNPLFAYLFGGKNDPNGFIHAVQLNQKVIATTLHHLADSNHFTSVIEQQNKTLTEQELEEWKSIATTAPTVEVLKTKAQKTKIGAELTSDLFFERLVHEMMVFDKHGPLDLILYADSHEEIRKWARNRIREIKVDKLIERLHPWVKNLEQTEVSHLLSPMQVKQLSRKMIYFIEDCDKSSAVLSKQETISSKNAFASIRQLICDLAEGVTRCVSRQTYLSTCLFLFWAADELIALTGKESPEIKSIGEKLLQNYIATELLIEKQIILETRQTISLATIAGNYRNKLHNGMNTVVGEATPDCIRNQLNF